MSGVILIPLKRSDRAEAIVPYIEQAAQPGMRVVLLIAYPIEVWPWLRDHWVTAKSSREAMRVGRQLLERYSWVLQQALAEQKVAPAREAHVRLILNCGLRVVRAALARLGLTRRAGAPPVLVHLERAVATS